MSGDAWLRLLGAVLFAAGVVLAVVMLLTSPRASMCDATFVDGTVTKIPC